MDIGTLNDFLVTRKEDGTFIMLEPPTAAFTRDQALRLAAHIIILSNREYEDVVNHETVLTIGQVMDAIMSV